MSSLFLRWLVLLLVLPTCSLAAQQILPDARFDSLRNSIIAWTATAASPAVSVGVYHRGEVLWQEGFGWKDAARTTTATDATIFPLASVTKTFTATAIMMLVEDGRIALDQPVANYFDHEVIRAHFPLARPVTVRDLLRHTAGLDMHYRNVYEEEAQEVNPPISASSVHNTLIFNPSERFAYANVGYTILGELIEVVSGKSYAAFLADRIFDPLGMTHTAVRIEENLRSEYADLRGAKGEVLPLVYTDTKGAGDIYSTAADLLQYGKLHLGNGPQGLLSEASLLAMRTVTDTTIVRPDPCQPYGLGWFFERSAGGPRAFWHEGGFDGAGSMLKIFPEAELIIAVVGNTTFNKARSGEITAAITNLLLPGYQPASCPETPLKPGVDTTAFSGKWVGEIYAGTDTIPLSLDFRSNDEIVAGFTDYQTRFFFIDDQAFPKQAFVHYPNSKENHLMGWLLEGIITTPDWEDNHHIIQLDLYRKGAEISGSAKAFETNQDREGMATAFYLRLQRQE